MVKMIPDQSKNYKVEQNLSLPLMALTQIFLPIIYRHCVGKKVDGAVLNCLQSEAMHVMHTHNIVLF